MEKLKETDVRVWVFGILLSVLFVTTIIWLALESMPDSDDPSDIIRKMYIAGGASVLLGVFFLFGWWFEKTRISNFEKNKGRIGLETDIGKGVVCQTYKQVPILWVLGVPIGTYPTDTQISR